MISLTLALGFFDGFAPFGVLALCMLALAYR